MPRRPSLFSDWVTLLACAVALFLYTAIHANAWFWWQIPVAASALTWFLPALLVAGAVGCRLLTRKGSLLGSVVTLVLVCSVLSKVVLNCTPFALADTSRHTNEGIPLRVLFSPVLPAGSSDQEVLLSTIGAGEAEVDVVVGTHGLDHSDPRFSSYPYWLEVPLRDGSRYTVVSKYPIDPESRTDFGDGGLPSAAIKLHIGTGTVCWIALLFLKESLEPDDFQVNRVAARRVATLFRNADEPAMIMADLRTPVFTKYYSILTRYLKLKNAFTGKGLFQGNETGHFFIPSAQQHILVRRNLPLTRSELIPSHSGNSYMLKFETRIPAHVPSQEEEGDDFSVES